MFTINNTDNRTTPVVVPMSLFLTSNVFLMILGEIEVN